MLFLLLFLLLLQVDGIHHAGKGVAASLHGQIDLHLSHLLAGDDHRSNAERNHVRSTGQTNEDVHGLVREDAVATSGPFGDVVLSVPAAVDGVTSHHAAELERRVANTTATYHQGAAGGGGRGWPRGHVPRRIAKGRRGHPQSQAGQMRPNRRLVAGNVLEEGGDGRYGDVGIAVLAGGRRSSNGRARTGPAARRTTAAAMTMGVRPSSSSGIRRGATVLLDLDGLARDAAEAQNCYGHVHHFELDGEKEA